MPLLVPLVDGVYDEGRAHQPQQLQQREHRQDTQHEHEDRPRPREPWFPYSTVLLAPLPLGYPVENGEGQNLNDTRKTHSSERKATCTPCEPVDLAEEPGEQLGGHGGTCVAPAPVQILLLLKLMAETAWVERGAEAAVANDGWGNKLYDEQCAVDVVF